MGCVS